MTILSNWLSDGNPKSRWLRNRSRERYFDRVVHINIYNGKPETVTRRGGEGEACIEKNLDFVLTNNTEYRVRWT